MKLSARALAGKPPVAREPGALAGKPPVAREHCRRVGLPRYNVGGHVYSQHHSDCIAAARDSVVL